jgi:outer membrane protein OmpA-like peptidoglycan-associated protein
MMEKTKDSLAKNSKNRSSDKSICIEIDNYHYVPLLSLQEKSKGMQRLTTIETGQRKAIIKIYRCSTSQKPVFIDSLEITGLPTEHLYKPVFILKGRFNGNNILTLSLYYNDKEIAHKEIKTGPNYRLVKSAALIFLLCLLAGTPILLLVNYYQRSELETDNQPVTERQKTQTEAPEKIGEKIKQTNNTQTDDTTQQNTGKTPPPEGISESPKLQETKTVTRNGDVAATENPGGETEKGDTQDTLTQVLSAEKSWIVYFNPDSAVSTPQAVELIKEVGEILSGTEYTINIYGHCANAGTEAGRIELSHERANAVKILLSQNIDSERFGEIQGLGASDPVTRNPESQYLNRRVVISIEK